MVVKKILFMKNMREKFCNYWMIMFPTINEKIIQSDLENLIAFHIARD